MKCVQVMFVHLLPASTPAPFSKTVVLFCGSKVLCFLMITVLYKDKGNFFVIISIKISDLW